MFNILWCGGQQVMRLNIFCTVILTVLHEVEINLLHHVIIFIPNMLLNDAPYLLMDFFSDLWFKVKGSGASIA